MAPTKIISFAGSKTECEQEVEMLRKRGIPATLRKLSPHERRFVIEGEAGNCEHIRHAVLLKNKKK